MLLSIAGSSTRARLLFAFCVSMAGHGAALLLFDSPGTASLHQQATPPASAIYARIFTYEKQAVAGKTDSTEAPAVQTSQQHADARKALAPDKTVEPDKAKTASLVASTAVAAQAANSEAVIDSALLTVSPALVSLVTLEYPLSANNREGVVTVEITVGSDGKVENITVASANPEGFFEAAAIAGFQNALFTPGMMGSIGVKSKMRIEVEFMPTNRRGSVSGQQ